MSVFGKVLGGVALAASLIGCGKMDTLSRQERHRDALSPELQGNWTTVCSGRKINQLNFNGQTLTVTRITFFDDECQEKIRTTQQSGSYQLAHNYKEGIANSIIVELAKEITVTLHTDSEVETFNNVLTTIRNEKGQNIEEGMKAQQKRDIIRLNALIRAGQDIETWRRDVAKTLRRLQSEKMDQYGFNSEVVGGEFGTRLSLKYEIDNGYLQMSGGGDFSRVFSKQ